jgi:hypothetical protein
MIGTAEVGDGAFSAVLEHSFANISDLSVTTEHESAGMESSAIPRFRGTPKAHPCRDGFSDNRQARMSPAGGTHPWHQTSISSCIMGRHVQAKVERSPKHSHGC